MSKNGYHGSEFPLPHNFYEEQIQELKKQLEQIEAERKEYHRKFCQERQRNIDSKPSLKIEKQNIELKQQLEEAIEVIEFYSEVDPFDTTQGIRARQFLTKIKGK